MERERHRVAVERLLQATAPEEREDLLRLADDGGPDGCIVQQCHAPIDAQPGERRLQLERLVVGERVGLGLGLGVYALVSLATKNETAA